MKEKEKIKNKMKDMIKKVKLSKSQVILMIIFSAITVVLSLGTSYAAVTYLYDSKDVSYDNTRSGIVATDVQGAVDELYSAANDYSSMNTRVTTIENSLLDKTYPVGSIYIGVNNTNPSTLFGGTWESFGEGRTLIGVGTGTDSNSIQKVFSSNETGGEYTHTLTINEMPSHRHGTPNWIMWDPGLGYHDSARGLNSYNSGNNIIDLSASWYSSYTGGSQSHNNIQPYITVYMWKRTA